jgi:hypothetical protein
MNNTTYQNYSHDEAIYLVESALTTAGISYTIAYQQFSPRKMVANFRFDDYIIEGLGGLIPQISVINSTDKSTALTLVGGVHRVVCSNGLVVGEIFDKERIIHRVGDTFDRKITSLPQRIVALIDNIIARSEELQELTAHTLTEEQMIEVTASITMSRKAKKAAIEDIVFQVSRRADDYDNNVWSLFNIINENLRKYSTRNAYTKHNATLLENIQTLAAA